MVYVQYCFIDGSNVTQELSAASQPEDEEFCLPGCNAM
jgi:hypothetical protein